MTMNITELPETVLRQVFRFLEFTDKLSLGLTCKKFADYVGTSYECMNDIILTVNLEKYDFGFISASLKCFSNSKRVYPNVYIQDPGETFELLTNDRINCIINLINSIGSGIRRFNISGYAVFPEDLVKILNMLPNLEELYVYVVQAKKLMDDQLIFCSKLKRLVITYKNNYTLLSPTGEFVCIGTDDSFKIFRNIKTLKSLEVLVTTPVNLCSLESFQKLLLNQRNLRLLKLQDSRFIDVFKPKLIDNLKMQLTSLNIIVNEDFENFLKFLSTQTDITDLRLEFESKDDHQPQIRILDYVLEHYQLKTLGMKSYLSTKQVNIQKSFPKIVEFSLVLDDDDENSLGNLMEFQKFVEAMSNLKSLELGGYKFKNREIELINRLLKLEKLTLLNGCSSSALSVLNFPQLRFFCIYISPEIATNDYIDSWIGFFERHKNIQELHFIGSSPPLVALQFAEEKLPKLYKITGSKMLKRRIHFRPISDLFAFARQSEKFGNGFRSLIDLIDERNSSTIILKRQNDRYADKRFLYLKDASVDNGDNGEWGQFDRKLENDAKIKQCCIA